jgi:hypothetical protein
MKHRFLGLGGVLLAVTLAATAAPAVARPPVKPTVSVPVLGNVTKAGSAYAVPATWTASANATSFAVKLINASGVTLDSGTVSTPSWTGHTTAPAGTVVRVTVTPYAGTRKGAARTSNTSALPDLTAPLGTFSVVRNNGTGGNIALHMDSLTDDVSAPSGITATVVWDTGGGAVDWPAPFGNLDHLYGETKAVHYITVKVTDQAGNWRDYPLTVVVNDTQAPAGAFRVSTASAWASWSKVTLQQVTVSDDVSLPTKIDKEVNWGDGTPTQDWPQGAAASHVYTKAGTFTPKVTLTDEAGNPSNPVATNPVVVKVDSAAPVLRLKPPATRKKSVRSWRVLKGTATDAGVGVRNVSVKAIEKRATGWYAYKAGTRTWVKAATKARAWAKATLASVKPTAAGAWSVQLSKLTKGTLLYKARAYDNRGNASGWVAKKAVLTRR